MISRTNFFKMYYTYSTKRVVYLKAASKEIKTFRNFARIHIYLAA